MPRLLITVDSEMSNFPRGMGLWARIRNDDLGFGRLLCGVSFRWGYGTATSLEAITEMEYLSDATSPWASLPTTHALSGSAGILISIPGRVAVFAQ